MSQVLFDTQFAVDDLRRAGFTDEQAKANVRFVRGAHVAFWFAVLSWTGALLA